MPYFVSVASAGDPARLTDAGIDPVIARLLVNRGITEPEEALAFLDPAPVFQPPEKLNGVCEAAFLIRKSITKGKRICIYGDYDADGVCASAILCRTLKKMKADVFVRLPERHTEGYGLNEQAVREIAAQAGLLVTVDCGISSAELITLAHTLGLQTIVTDHHTPGETIPDGICIDPLLPGGSIPYLCGAGVAWELARALIGEEAMELIDLCAAATVADIVPLRGENRKIVREGLRRMNAAPRACLEALRKVSGREGRPFDTTMLGYQIGPRINSSGRLDTAMTAFRLLTAQRQDEIDETALLLDRENRERRLLTDEIDQRCEELLPEYDLSKHRVIVLAQEGWNKGTIGLAASRLTERYYRPSVVISLKDGIGTASCRSIDGVDLFDLLSRADRAAGGLFVRYGGHRKAAGLTIAQERIGEMITLCDRILAELPEEVFRPVIRYDMELKADEIGLDLLDRIDCLAPFGEENPEPRLLVRGRVDEARSMSAGKHLKFWLRGESRRLECLWWGRGDLEQRFDTVIESVVSLQRNDFNGRISAQATVQGLRIPLVPFLTELMYNQKIPDIDPDLVAMEGRERIPDRNGIGEVWKALLTYRGPVGSEPGPMELAEALSLDPVKLVSAMVFFKAAGLIAYREGRFQKTGKQANFDSHPVIRILRQLRGEGTA